MHTFYINVLINYSVFDIFLTPKCPSSIRQLIWMHERNTIKLHVQIFLRINPWMFETCRSSYD